MLIMKNILQSFLPPFDANQVNKTFFLFLLIIYTCNYKSHAQTVEHGRESASGTVNFTVLANYLLAHPEPFVVRDEDDEDEDVSIPHIRPVLDSISIRRRATLPSTTTSSHTSLLPSTFLPISPAPTDTFESTVDPLTTIPPDTHGGVDGNYCVTAINTNVKIQSRAGGAVSSVSLNSFFSSVNSVGGTFDPRVHYDPYSNRWILVCVSGANNSTDSTSILIGVTQTGDPTGTWNLFRVRAYTPHTYWLDYPDVGFNGKWITVTGNLFQNSPGTGYNGAKVFVFNKSGLMAGTSATYTAFTQASSFTICPAINNDPNTPNMYAVESWNGTTAGGGVMNLWKISGAVGSESLTHVSYPQSPFNWDWEANLYSGTAGGDFAPQAGTSNKIQTNDDRVTQVIYMNGKLWFAHNVFLPYTGTTNPTRCSVQWSQIDTTGTPTQVGLDDDNTSTNYYAFPSIAVNKSNDALIGFSAFSSATYPSAAYALRLHTDATDSIRPVQIFRHGVTSYYKTFSGSKNRWGDYSGTCLDPTDSNNFWTIQEASASHTTADRWDTWWAHVLTPCSAPASITGTFTVCVGATTTLSDATSGGTWSSSATGTATVGSSTGVVTGVSSGTVTITYSTGVGCTATHTVTVNPLATPGTISGTPTVCVGATTSLTASGTSGGTWSSTNTAVGTVSAGGVVGGVSGGNTTISYTVTNSCGSVAATQIVTVNPLATPGTISGTPTVCVGATTTLTASGTSGGTWSSTNTAIGTVSAGGVVGGISGGTVTISYTVTNSCGPVAATQVVTVNPLATPGTISGTPTVCVGATTSLTASGTTGGTWSSTNTAVGTVSASGVVSGISSGNTTISYTVTNSCGSVAATQIVTVNPLAIPGTISGTFTVCVAATTTLSTSGTSGGTWSSTNTVAGTVSSSGVVTGIATGNTTISYTVTNSCGTAAATRVVTVNAPPSAITGTAEVCVGSSTTLSSTTSGGTWTSGSTGIATVVAGTGVVSGVSAGTAVITYSVSTGCYVTQTVTIDASPSAISGASAVCAGSTITITSSPSGGTWTSSNTGVASVGSASGVVVGIAGGSSAIITYLLGSGCFATHTVSVTAAPGGISGTMVVCTGSSTTLSCSPSGGLWTSGGTGTATVGSSSGVVTGVSAGTVDITYSLGTGCESIATVTVNTAPSTISGASAVCVGATITLSSSPSGGTWLSSSPGLATVGSGTGVVTGIGAGVANITYILSSGCFDVHPVTVTSTPGSISGSATVCTGATTTLSCSPTGGLWTSGITGTATVGSSSGIVTGVSVGTATITYSLGAGCESYLIVTVSTTPAAITGTAAICMGGSTLLSTTTSGGTWTSGNTAVASVGAGTGVVTSVSVGTANITYTVGSCFVTQLVTVNTTPGTITGTPTVCVGLTTTLSSSPSGGTWTSTVLGVATVGSGTGTVLGVGSGGTVISYSLSTGCGTGVPVTVYANPTPISGIVALCPGGTTTLSSTPAGGSWTSGSAGVATVGSSSGIVAAVSTGTAIITYTAVTSGCIATTTETVNASPTITLGTNPSVPAGSTSANLTYSGTSGGASTYSVVYSSAAHTAGFSDVTGLAITTPIVLTVPGTAPAAIYSGTLTVTNATCASINYPITVTITSGSDAAPVFSAGSPQSSSACANPTVNSIDALLQISDPDVGDLETWTVVSGPVHGSITTGGTMVSTGGTVTPSGFSYTASPGYTGTDVFTMQVNDGAGGVSTTTINVTVNPLPASYTVTGGGSYCAGGTGFHVGLGGSASGISYQLYNGVTPDGSPLTGTGVALDFGLKTAAGVYTVVATNTTTSCSRTMTGSATIVLNPLPNIYAMTGGGAYCSGGSGIVLGLAGSDAGVNYQLFRGTTYVGGTVSGTGSAISFGVVFIAGTYTVVATNPATGCAINIIGSATVVVNGPPAIIPMIGGGGYCSGGAGVNVGIGG